MRSWHSVELERDAPRVADAHLRVFPHLAQVYVAGDDPAEGGTHCASQGDDDIYAMINAYWEKSEFHVQ